MTSRISKSVWLLSLISLFNDFSSEMLFPILPLFFQQIGYGSVLIGVIEGITEFVTGMAKIGLGKLSDRYQTRLPFIQIGYFLSVASRPIIGLSHYFGLILTARSIDRIGKGIRTASRDALLADESTPETKAEVFGFHRSMDTVGAILGPLTALIYLHFNPGNYRSIFLITIIPGFMALLFTLLLKERRKEKHDQINTPKPSFWSYFSYYKEAPTRFLHLLFVLLAFSLLNSSDVFLLLRAKEIGYNEQQVIGMYILFNLCFALVAYPVGRISNRFGALHMLVIGLTLYAISYLLFGLLSQPSYFIPFTFCLYGLYYAFTQGTIKVLLLHFVSEKQRASAIGFYEGLNSFTLLVANALTGIAWYSLGASTTLIGISFIVLLIVIYLFIQRKKYR